MWTRWPGTLVLCTLATGCQLANNGVHDLTYETKLALADAVEHRNYEKLAQACWVQITGHYQGFSKDYACGFKEGFVDYLQFGGSGRPPYVPPKRFWGPYYRTPEGHRKVEEWYAGFRHGVAEAQQSGYRQSVTMPSALTTEPPPVPPAPGRGDPAFPPMLPAPDSGNLPMPAPLETPSRPEQESNSDQGKLPMPPPRLNAEGHETAPTPGFKIN